MHKIISKSPKQTGLFAKQVAANLKGGEILALVGELGAGKTFFVQALGRALKVKTRITSPTFILLKIYKTNHKKIKIIYHLDAYRIKKANDFLNLGIEDLWKNKEAIVAIEWADKIKSILPLKAIFIEFKVLGGKKREIKIK